MRMSGNFFRPVNSGKPPGRPQFALIAFVLGISGAGYVMKASYLQINHLFQDV